MWEKFNICRLDHSGSEPLIRSQFEKLKEQSISVASSPILNEVMQNILTHFPSTFLIVTSSFS